MPKPRIRLDKSRRELFVNGREVHLAPKEWGILDLLVTSNIAKTRENIMREVWGYEVDIDSRTVDQHIARLRRKLGTARDTIRTVSGYGFKYAA